MERTTSVNLNKVSKTINAKEEKNDDVFTKIMISIFPQISEPINKKETVYDEDFIKMMINKFPQLSEPDIAEEQFKKFYIIWKKYNKLLYCNSFDYNNYMKIIIKIQNNDLDFVEDKKVFIDLIDDLLYTIYYYNLYDRIYDKVHYDIKKMYKDNELICCNMIKYLVML